ncbi:putative secondary metabolism biosynthetic enzyme [Glutinoglossum americanum]|uniref:Secondary metabolism biosynthetic enzyme n=1 Tax=Glutinoglossum americanum TaxID=1670608 RepID=A0A9P8KX45_9PEZI|nr:putative secondary metabolism biosynthetic enzyme [Glutinoglossum americanum]
MVGAKIYTTVGSEEKIQYLMLEYSIPRDHIFNSRNTSFLPSILRATHSRGVDVVLNSLSGELLHASWQCVAEFGKMIEIGKRDLVGRGKLDMDLFEGNRMFVGVDFAGIFAHRPGVTERLLERCMDLYRQGSIKPIPSVTLFPGTKVEDAFRCMQKGQHIGKIVVSMPSDPDLLPVTPIAHPLSLRPDASYLLPGGLGGLGRAVSVWLAEHGATNLIYLSRSAGRGAGDQAFFKELRGMGCEVKAFAGGVDCVRDVENVISMAAKPIAGVINMSMVLRGRALTQMTHSDWETAISPKVQGTLNLHSALSSHALDFFVLFSSLSGMVGRPSQANYASANTFLDAFVQYRHGLGLPASVLVVGAVEDVGFISDKKAILDHFHNIAIHTLRERDLLESLQLAIMRSAPPSPEPSNNTIGFTNTSQLAIGLKSTKPLSDSTNRVTWRRDIRTSMYCNIETTKYTTDRAVDAGLRQFLTTVAANPRVLDAQSSADLLTREIGTRLSCFMLLSEDELDVTQSLSAIGVDSLVAIEVRNWWRQNLGLEISVLEILNAGSVVQMGKLAAEGLRVKFGGEAEKCKAAVKNGDDYFSMKVM